MPYFERRLRRGGVVKWLQSVNHWGSRLGSKRHRCVGFMLMGRVNSINLRFLPLRTILSEWATTHPRLSDSPETIELGL